MSNGIIIQPTHGKTVFLPSNEISYIRRLVSSVSQRKEEDIYIRMLNGESYIFPASEVKLGDSGSGGKEKIEIGDEVYIDSSKLKLGVVVGISSHHTELGMYSKICKVLFAEGVVEDFPCEYLHKTGGKYSGIIQTMSELTKAKEILNDTNKTSD